MLISRYDGYILRQMIAMWGFATLVLVGVFWISRSIGLFSTLLAGGHSPWVFFELTALTLPTLVRTVMPMAIFTAVVYVTNRGRRESELVVMQSTGSSALRLARPVFYFSAFCAVMIGAITLVLRPQSLASYELRETELENDVAAQLLREGDFLHPIEGVVLYIGKVGFDSTLRDVFISDQRQPKEPLTYTAAEAYLVPQGNALYAVLVNGMATRYNASQEMLSVTWFEDFTFDLSRNQQLDDGERPKLNAVPSRDLLLNADILIDRYGFSNGDIVEEFHERLSWIGISIAVALVAFAALMMGVHSRFGLWGQISVAFIVLIGLEASRGVVAGVVANNPSIWWLYHIPALAGVLCSVLLLKFSGRPLFRKRTIS